MTDNTQELDEILEILHNSWLEDDYDPKDPDAIYAKQALLDWHNKQIENYKGIIKMSDTYKFETGEVYYSEKAVNKQIEEVLDRAEEAADEVIDQFSVHVPKGRPKGTVAHRVMKKRMTKRLTTLRKELDGGSDE